MSKGPIRCLPPRQPRCPTCANLRYDPIRQWIYACPDRFHESLPTYKGWTP